MKALVFLLLGLSLLYVTPEVRAQSHPNCMNNALGAYFSCPDRQSAYEGARQAALAPANSGHIVTVTFSGFVDPQVIGQSGAIGYRVSGRNAYGEVREVTGYRSWTVECVNGLPWSEATYTCGTGCEGKPVLSNKSVQGANAGRFCEGGCFYAQQGNSVCIEIGGSEYCSGASWAPTGATCSAGDAPAPLATPYNPDRPTCVSTGGGYSECVEPSGRHCVTGAQGGRYCYEPGETGPRSNAQGTEGVTRTAEGQSPEKPANMPDATGTTGATTTINNVTTTTTNYTGGGGTPGQGNVGEGGCDASRGSCAGSGDDGEGDGPGGVGPGLGDLYEGEGGSVGDLYGDFKARVESAPIVAAAAGFFAAPAGGGCPTFTLSASAFWEAMTFDYHCSGPLSVVLGLAGWLVLAVAAFFAVRIAIE